MKIIVGLGNPDKKYKNTRHNVGFSIMDAITQSPEFKVPSSKLEKKFHSEISECRVNKEKTLLVKPQTFMNHSGEAVSKVLSFYKIKPKNLIVVHDDIDLPLGTLKISFGEGAAGHKGVLSIINCLGRNEFWRIRVGILSRPKEKIDAEKFVLGKFTNSELEVIDKVIERIILEIKNIVKEEIVAKKISIN